MFEKSKEVRDDMEGPDGARLWSTKPPDIGLRLVSALDQTLASIQRKDDESSSSDAAGRSKTPSSVLFPPFEVEQQWSLLREFASNDNIDWSARFKMEMPTLIGVGKSIEDIV